MLEKKVFSTKNSPEIRLSPDGIIKIFGRSMGANTAEISEEIDKWIDSYVLDPADVTCIDIHLEYLKGTDLKFYISLLKKICTVRLKYKKCIINWYYEEGDEDMLEMGESISFLLDIPFNMIEINDRSVNSTI
jgi:hypothetical protein